MTYCYEMGPSPGIYVSNSAYKQVNNNTLLLWNCHYLVVHYLFCVVRRYRGVNMPTKSLCDQFNLENIPWSVLMFWSASISKVCVLVWLFSQKVFCFHKNGSILRVCVHLQILNLFCCKFMNFWVKNVTIDENKLVLFSVVFLSQFPEFVSMSLSVLVIVTCF